MSFATKKGDQGQTDIANQRISKTDSRIEVLGQLDELSAQLIITSCFCPQWEDKFRKLVMTLSNISSILANYLPPDSFSEESCNELEQWIDELSEISKSFQFQYPFCDRSSAECNLLRTKIRSVERTCWQVHQHYPLPAEILRYINRLSDLAFAMQLNSSQPSLNESHQKY